MTEPAVALVFSPEPWVERLHRHCADHGGARIRQVIVEPRVALEETYDTLVVSHRWPALSPGLVSALHARGRRVLGVFDLAEPAGHEHLVRLEADAIVAADAPMDAFVDAIVELGITSHGLSAEHVDPVRNHRDDLGRVVAVFGTSGSGATEVAIESARALARSGRRTVLVDADDRVPAIVPRLSLPPEPNVRSAIDGAVYDGRPAAVIQVDAGGFGFAVLGGLPNPAAWDHVHPEELLLVLEQLASSYDLVVVNVGSHLELVGEEGRDRFGMSRCVVGVADALLIIADASPVGVIRSLMSVADVVHLAPNRPLNVVVNRAPRDGFRRAELEEEIRRSISVTSFGFIPDDHRVRDAVWASSLVLGGPFTRAIRDIVPEALLASSRRTEVAIG